MGETLHMVKGFINDMVLETSHMDVPTVVEDNSETTAVSKLGNVEPVVVHKNDNGAMKLANTGLKSNNTLGAHIVERKKDDFINGLTSMMCGMITPLHLQKRMNWGAPTRSRMII